MLADKVAEAGVLPAEAVDRVEGVVASPLACQIGGQVGAAGGDADGVVEVYPSVQTGVQHPAAIDASEAASGVQHTDFHPLFYLHCLSHLS